MPFALRPAVEAELDPLEKQGTLESTQHSEWTTPLVLVRKGNGQLCLCSNYSSTVNAISQKATHPLPMVEEPLSQLQTGKIFSILDLADSYQQLSVTPEAVVVLTMNILNSLYKVRRIPFAVVAAPAIFQWFMAMTLSGVPGTCIYQDDLAISGATVEEHASRLEMALGCLKTANLRLSWAKCKFTIPEVNFLGHKVGAAEIHTTRDKIHAIVEASPLTSKQSLRAFLGLLSFCHRFLEQQATIIRDPYQLLQKDVAWTWEEKHQQAFEILKHLLLQRIVLAHYDQAKPLVISCDTSPYRFS